MERVPTTAEGLKVLADELKQLKSVERPAIIKAIAAAREHGDLSENAEYTSAREQQGFIEGRIAEIEDIISRAEVIDFSKLSGKIVKFGATVRLADEDTDEKVKYQIVGPYEADLGQGPHLRHLADRPGADRQDGGRYRRGPDPARRQVLRGRGSSVQIAVAVARTAPANADETHRRVLDQEQRYLACDAPDRHRRRPGHGIEREREDDVEGRRAEHQPGPDEAEDVGEVRYDLRRRSAADSGSSSPVAACRPRRCSR